MFPMFYTNVPYAPNLPDVPYVPNLPDVPFVPNVPYVPMSQMTELLQLLQMFLKKFTNAVQTLLLLFVTVV